jgi:hypothetical protein
MLPGEAAQVRRAGDWVIAAFENQFEDDDWDDGTGWMGSLMSLRSELLRGDLRCLYLGWLLSAQNEEFAEDELEPAVPAGLGELSAPLRSLIEFLGIDEDLVEVAASASAPLNASPDREELATWIQSLPEKKRTICWLPRSQKPANGGSTDCCDVSSNRKRNALCPSPTEFGGALPVIS